LPAYGSIGYDTVPGCLGELHRGDAGARRRLDRFGLFAYATYDLTNLAALRDWLLGLSLMDMAWGSFASLWAGAAGKAVFDRLARGA